MFYSFMRNNSNIDITNQILAKTQQWLQQIVIGLNFCPFAKQPYDKGLVDFSVSKAQDLEGLVLEIYEKFQFMNDIPEMECETLLIIVPKLLSNFNEYNQFLDVVDTMIMEYGWEGVFQIASFHPDYQFSGTKKEDVTNFTNRAPYPIFHILRESSVQRAVTSQAHIDAIIERNQVTLRELSEERLKSLFH